MWNVSITDLLRSRKFFTAMNPPQSYRQVSLCLSSRAQKCLFSAQITVANCTHCTNQPCCYFQVTESHLRKRMEDVKELFTETCDVFRELVAAKAQVTARMTECMSSIKRIKDALSTLADSKGPQLIQDIQVHI